MFLPLGGFVAGLLAAYMLPHSGWRALFVAIAVISLVGDAAILAFLPESPQFLARKPSRRAAASRILRRIGIELSEETIATEPAATRAAPLTALFAKDIRIETLCLWLAFFFVVMSLYAIFAWTPSVLNQQGITLAGSSEALSAFAAGGVFAGPVSGWLSERIGARKTFFIVSVGAFVAAILLALCIASHAQQFALYLIGLIVLGWRLKRCADRPVHSRGTRL